MPTRLWVSAGGIGGAAGVALAAYAAHAQAAPGGNPALIETAARFLLLHATVLIGIAWLADRAGGIWPALAGTGFILGLILFCGTLTLAGMGFAIPMAAAPVGGVVLILAWLALAAAALRQAL